MGPVPGSQCPTCGIKVPELPTGQSLEDKASRCPGGDQREQCMIKGASDALGPGLDSDAETVTANLTIHPSDV